MRKIIKIVLSSILIVIFYVLWYYYPRTVSFEFVTEIQKPYKKFDRSYFKGFHYVNSKDRLIFWLVKNIKAYNPQKQGYDSITVEKLAENLDFQRYDYMIGYQKQLKKLRHSPHLTRTEDGLYFDKRTPLIPTWDSIITNKVYIYRIKKNKNYRSPGP